jgi:hypothetical protein
LVLRLRCGNARWDAGGVRSGKAGLHASEAHAPHAAAVVVIDAVMAAQLPAVGAQAVHSQQTAAQLRPYGQGVMICPASLHWAGAVVGAWRPPSAQDSEVLHRRKLLA